MGQGAQSPSAQFTGLAACTGLARIEEWGRKEGRREGWKEKREKGERKKGNHRACAKAGPEYATVTTVRLGALLYSHYSALEIFYILLYYHNNSPGDGMEKKGRGGKEREKKRTLDKLEEGMDIHRIFVLLINKHNKACKN